MSPGQRLASGIELAGPQGERRQPQRPRVHESLCRGYGLRPNRVRERDELLRDVLVGIVEHGPVDRVTAIESLLRVSMKPDADRRAAERREDGARAGEQLEIQDRVEVERAHPSRRADAVPHQRNERSDPDRNDVLRVHDIEQVERGLVLF